MKCGLGMGATTRGRNGGSAPSSHAVLLRCCFFGAVVSMRKRTALQRVRTEAHPSFLVLAFHLVVPYVESPRTNINTSSSELWRCGLISKTAFSQCNVESAGREPGMPNVSPLGPTGPQNNQAGLLIAAAGTDKFKTVLIAAL